MEEEHFTPFPECPICGTSMEDFFMDDDGCLLFKGENGIEDAFLVDEGVFKFIQDDEHKELQHLDWHHRHE